MCLAIPGKIISIDTGEAVIDYGGLTKRASVRLMPEAKPGDTVLVHAGFVIQILGDDEGDELMNLVAEMMEFMP